MILSPTPRYTLAEIEAGRRLQAAIREVRAAEAALDRCCGSFERAAAVMTWLGGSSPWRPRETVEMRYSDAQVVTF